MRRSSKVILVLFLLVVGLVGWIAYYVQDKGFTDRWRRLVHAEFEKRGIHATIRRLNLDPLRGLIAKDVLVYEDDEHEILLMSVSQIALDIDITKLFTETFSLRSFEVRNARISIPLEPQRRLKGEKLTLDNFSARILTPPGNIEIVKARADIHGLAVQITGSLLKKPSDEKPEEEKAPKDLAKQQKNQLKMIRDRREAIAAFLHQMKQIEYAPEAEPQLAIQLDGDLSKPREIRASGTLKSGPFKYSTYAAEALQAKFDYAGERLVVHELELADSEGKLRSRLEYDPAKNDLVFSFRSTADLHKLINNASSALVVNQIAFYHPPTIEASGVYHLGQPFDFENMPMEVSGKLETDGFISKGTIFDSMSADFSAKGNQLYLRNGRLEHKTGILTWDILRDSNGARFRSKIRMDPSVFGRFVAEGTRNFLSRWTFDENSAVFVELEGAGPTLSPRGWTSTGLIDLRNCQLNGHPIDHLRGELDFEGRNHHYRNIIISRPEGEVTGEHVHFNNETQICQLHGIKGRVFPTHAVGWFAPRAAQRLVVYDFKEPPNLTIEGSIDVRPGAVIRKEGARHDYRFTFDCSSEANYELFGKNLLLEEPCGVVYIKGDSVQLNDFKATTLDGQLRANVKLTNIHDEPHYDVALNVDEVNFQKLAELYSSFHDTGGELTGSANFQGRGPGIANVVASGEAVVTEGNVFSIPAFGPLNDPVKEALPKVHSGFSVAREAKFSFTVEDGKFRTEDFEAMTNAFLLKGQGEVDLVSNEMDLEATVNVRGAAGRILAPVSKLLEFQGEGNLAAPEWKAKNVAKLKSTLKEATIGGITGDAVKATGGAVKATGGAVKKTGGVMKRATEGLTGGISNLPNGRKPDGKAPNGKR